MDILIQVNDRELLIDVADRGIGIKPDTRERICERGVTTKTQGDHGFGLYLIDSYLPQVDGTTEVADDIPCGAIFSLFIPTVSKIWHQDQ